MSEKEYENGRGILQGDCLDVLPTLPEQSVHCVVTSPPYWGLRDYGTAEWEGGDEGCDHQPPDDAGTTTKPTNGQRQHAGRFAGPHCFKCGARRIDQQLGLEATPEEYVEKMVAVFRAVRRVLRDDGTLWLNLGDSYASQPAGRMTTSGPIEGGGFRANKPFNTANTAVTGLKPKDLCGIPWRVALALQADGWYLRQDIIWHKPNPMPESVNDRCTKAHEYVFLLTKSARYYFDAEAIKEPWTSGRDDMRAHGIRTGEAYIQQGTVADNSRKGARAAERNQHDYKGGRNKRSVWTVTTQPYPGAHFATFPPKLIEPCILAGCPEGGTVLDPFMGSGTTLYVARKNGCHGIGIELNEDYIRMARKRLEQQTLL